MAARKAGAKRGGVSASTQDTAAAAPRPLPTPRPLPHEPLRGPPLPSRVQRMARLQLLRGWFRGKVRALPGCHSVKLVFAPLFIFGYIFSRYCLCSPSTSARQDGRCGHAWSQDARRKGKKASVNLGQVWFDGCLNYPLRLPPGKGFHYARIFQV